MSRRPTDVVDHLFTLIALLSLFGFSALIAAVLWEWFTG